MCEYISTAVWSGGSDIIAKIQTIINDKIRAVNKNFGTVAGNALTF